LLGADVSVIASRRAANLVRQSRPSSH